MDWLNIYKNTNELKKDDDLSVSELGKVRKAVFPLLEQFVQIIKEAFSESIAKFRITKADFPDVQKVELTNYEPPVINVTEKTVTFPKVQDVKLTNYKQPIINVVEKKIEFPNIQVVKVKNQFDGNITNLPLGKDKKASVKDANPTKYVVVRLTDGQQFIDSFGSSVSSSNTGGGEKIWLREEYQYTTVSGQSVPSRVIKWDSQFKLTLDYQYDSNANPIIMSRSIEPLVMVGS